MYPILHMLSSLPNVEGELDEADARTGRWRRRQFYAQVGDARTPSDRVPCEWRTGAPR